MNRSLLLFIVLLAIGFGCSSNGGHPFPGSAEKIYVDALAAAKKSDKAVQLVFSHPKVTWCQRLDEYHADAQVATILDKHLISIRFDLIETPGGFNMFLERGSAERGQPAFTFVDYKGMLLADSGDVGENVGFPNNDDEVARYLTALKTACPTITTEELALLRAKLEALRVEITPEREPID
jgi:hypothetical protein